MKFAFKCPWYEPNTGELVYEGFIDDYETPVANDPSTEYCTHMRTLLASGFPERGWLLTLGVGLLAGWLASIILGRSRTGLLANLLVGVLGSFVGGYLFDFFDIQLNGFLGAVATATAGAIVLLIVLRVLYRAS